MTERTVVFGPDDGMVGILSEPDHGAARGPTVLLFNVGLNHHVGPHRMNVELARVLAERGVVTLRFDLSGLGDSEPRRDSRSDEERAVLDVREAMDYLGARKGITEFIVVGLCSGVDPAHAVAVKDARVRGAVFIDGYAYATPGYYIREIVDRALRGFVVSNYRRWFLRVVLPFLDARARPDNRANPIFDRAFPPLPQFQRDLETMLHNGVQMLFLYTRQAYFFNYLAQFPVMIKTRTVPHGIEVEHQLGADHVFTSTFERARGVRRVADWIETHFGADVVPNVARGANGESNLGPRQTKRGA